MVSVGVSALGKTEIHYIEPGVKINGAYYRDCLLSEKLLPDIREYSEYSTFQQDGAPAHRARETVELLTKETPDFMPSNLWPPSSHIYILGLSKKRGNFFFLTLAKCSNGQNNNICGVSCIYYHFSGSSTNLNICL